MLRGDAYKNGANNPPIQVCVALRQVDLAGDKREIGVLFEVLESKPSGKGLTHPCALDFEDVLLPEGVDDDLIAIFEFL